MTKELEKVVTNMSINPNLNDSDNEYLADIISEYFNNKELINLNNIDNIEKEINSLIPLNYSQLYLLLENIYNDKKVQKRIFQLNNEIKKSLKKNH